MFAPGLYAITDASLGPRLLPAVRAALEGGAVVLQYRDKSANAERRAAEARALLALCREFRIPLLINDDIALAEAVGADGVHLGQGDGSLQAARARLGPHAIIGMTCHNSLDLAEAAAAAGADYLAFGAIYPSATKPGAQAASLSTLRQARQRWPLPVVAIGGITVANAPPVIAAGAHGLAVIADLWQAADIRAQAAAFAALFQP